MSSGSRTGGLPTITPSAGQGQGHCRAADGARMGGRQSRTPLQSSGGGEGRGVETGDEEAQRVHGRRGREAPLTQAMHYAPASRAEHPKMAALKRWAAWLCAYGREGRRDCATEAAGRAQRCGVRSRHRHNHPGGGDGENQGDAGGGVCVEHLRGGDGLLAVR